MTIDTTRARGARRRRAGLLVGILAAALASAPLAAPGPAAASSHTPSDSYQWSGWSSGNYQTATAWCATNQVVAGGGVVVEDAQGAWEAGQVTGMFPVQDASGRWRGIQVEARQWETGHNWRVRAHAVCINPPSGYLVRSATSTKQLSYQDSTAVTQTACPSGRTALGAGGRVRGNSPYYSSRMVLEQVGLRSDAGTPRGVTVRSFYGDHLPQHAWTSAYAICANVTASLQSATSTYNGSPGKSATRVCSAGHAYSTGWLIGRQTVGAPPAFTVLKAQRVDVHTPIDHGGRVILRNWHGNVDSLSWRVTTQVVCR